MLPRHNMKTRPPKRTLTETQETLRVLKIPKNHNVKSNQSSTFIIKGFKLLQPRLTKPEDKDDWQHPTPQPTKVDTLIQHTDLETHDIKLNESENYLFELYKNSHTRYITETPPQ